MEVSQNALSDCELTCRLYGMIFAHIFCNYNHLMQETEKYVYENSFVGNSAVLIYTCDLAILFFARKKMEHWSVCAWCRTMGVELSAHVQVWVDPQAPYLGVLAWFREN